MGVIEAAARGRAFEDEVAALLRAAGFQVNSNAKIAKPRQTDLLAQGEGIELLIETKDRRRKVDVWDIDSLRSRLARAPPDIVGAIFTTSGLTKGAIDAIEADRTREILTFVGDEIDYLRSGRKNLFALIERKRSELRVYGKVWFGKASHSDFAKTALPAGNVEFRFVTETTPFFESRSRSMPAFYSLHIPDSGWGLSEGEGARLLIRPELHSLNDLQSIVGYLHQQLGLSSNGAFAIHQTDTSWYGVGADNFLAAVERWKERYARSGARSLHHSEELIYFDQVRNGWLELSTQQRVDPSGKLTPFLHGSGLAIQLPGVPVDATPYLKLCRHIGDQWATFEYVGRRWTSTMRLASPIRLKTVGRIVNKERLETASEERERIVIGIVARNPFYRKKALPKITVDSEDRTLHELADTELLVCSLRDWHDEGDSGDCYELEGFEVTIGDASRIIRPFGTWNTIQRLRNSLKSSSS